MRSAHLFKSLMTVCSHSASFMKWLSLELQPLLPVLQSIRLDCTVSESSQGFWKTCFQSSPLNTLYFLSFWRPQEDINSTRLMVKDLLRLAAALNRRPKFQLHSSFLIIVSPPCQETPPKVKHFWMSVLCDVTKGAYSALKSATGLDCGWLESCFFNWLIMTFGGKDCHLNEGSNSICMWLITWNVSLPNWCLLESISEQWTICPHCFLCTRQNILIR